ncbi:sensor histidine kinase [Blautia marasmi]|uniref:sensor histidine kinase n=1 Tax=Blautia marasmi TaxID=1917868 RepID=UPI000CF1F6D0|nr:HAMP domain-containing sensor histidine kinase [Blautia marasmi]
MNTTVIIGICVCIIICLLAMLAAVIAACRLREKKLLRRLQEMLEDAVAGTFSEGKLMDTGISELESAMWRFLNDSQLSSVQLAEQKQRIQSLISDISHQTVTPIANIKIYAELLGEQQEKWKAGDSSVKEDIAEEIEAVIDQVDKLDFLIGSLVKLSRLENGILELEPKRCCIREVLSAINRQFQPKAQQKGITLVIDDSGEEAEFDLRWTIEAVGNIVDNAIKYTPEGGTVSLHVVLYSMFLRLDVADTGIGIAEQEQASVFTRFYRSRKAAEQPGVGIGLYFAREVLRRERGYIKVSSEPDKGSVFSVFLYRG